LSGGPDGKLNAYSADRGQKLWSFSAGLGITGAPITFTVAGKQYIAVVAGWGGLGAAYFGPLSSFGWQYRTKHNRLFIFRLGGKAAAPPPDPSPPVQPIEAPSVVLDPAQVEQGGQLFARTCVACHGAGAVSAGLAPDLRASPLVLDAAGFRSIVHDGTLLERGMPPYAELSDSQLESLRQFIRARARSRQ
jgi:quinohemoprotein ethanol dehydrogenase